MPELNDTKMELVAKQTQSPIDKAATEHSNCLADLEQSLYDLFSRISPILGPDFQQHDPSGEDASPEVSRLQKYFMDETDHVNRIAAMVRSTTSRVEC